MDVRDTVESRAVFARGRESRGLDTLPKMSHPPTDIHKQVQESILTTLSTLEVFAYWNSKENQPHLTLTLSTLTDANSSTL